MCLLTKIVISYLQDFPLSGSWVGTDVVDEKDQTNTETTESNSRLVVQAILLPLYCARLLCKITNTGKRALGQMHGDASLYSRLRLLALIEQTPVNQPIRRCLRKNITLRDEEISPS